MSEEKVEVKQEGEFKMKAKSKPKKLSKKTKKEAIKVDLSTPPETTTKVVVEEEKEKIVEEKAAIEPEKKETVEPVNEAIIEEIKPEELKEIHKNIEQEVQQKESIELPENVEKLVSFMKETGGNVEDYVRLNADYSDIDDSTLLKEYYKKIKSHLEVDEIEFLLEDKFSYDEDIDDDRDIRKKKLEMKEEVAKARGFLEETKKKYYDEIKLRPGVTQDQQKAMDFFDRHNQDQKVNLKNHEDFKNKTKNYFTEDFKGFDFKLGEKNFRYKVNNPSDVGDAQSNINNFVKKFLNEDGSFKDYQGYHKALYAARNAYTMANHFYEQGKTDAIRDVNAKSKI